MELKEEGRFMDEKTDADAEDIGYYDEGEVEWFEDGMEEQPYPGLPRVTSVEPGASPSSLVSNTFDRTFRILVVDDEEDVRRALSMTLQRSKVFKCEIETAEDGEKGLEILASKPVDLVMSDFRMPKMTGVEFLSKVREKYPDVVRIIITGYSDITIVKDAITKAQVHNYIEKPWDNEELRRVVYETLRKNLKAKPVKKVKRIKHLPFLHETPDIEKLFESEEGRAFIDQLITSAGMNVEVHTVVDDPLEDGLPEIEDREEKIRLLLRYGLADVYRGPPLILNCPKCASPDYHLTPACIFCSSENVEKEEAIEHYKCGYIGGISEFNRDGHLVCPKCEKNIRQVGVDYRKVGSWVTCNQCHQSSGEANTLFFCNSCRNRYSLTEASWKKTEKVIPNERKILDYVTKLSVIGAVEETLKTRGLTVIRNIIMRHSNRRRKFHLACFGRGSETPSFLCDVYVDMKGHLINEARNFFAKTRGMSYPATFIAVPTLSPEAKQMCDKLGVKYLILKDEKEARERFSNLLPNCGPS